MRYVIIAILLYFVFIFVRRFLRNLSSVKNKNPRQNKDNTSQKKSYDVNMIQDAEFREVKKD